MRNEINQSKANPFCREDSALVGFDPLQLAFLPEGFIGRRGKMERRAAQPVLVENWWYLCICNFAVHMYI